MVILAKTNILIEATLLFFNVLIIEYQTVFCTENLKYPYLKIIKFCEANHTNFMKICF